MSSPLSRAGPRSPFSERGGRWRIRLLRVRRDGADRPVAGICFLLGQEQPTPPGYEKIPVDLDKGAAGSTSTPRSPAGPATSSRTSPSSPPATWSQPAQRVPTDRRGPQQGRRRKVHLLLLPHLTDATGPGTGSGRQKGSSTCLRRGAGGRLVPPDPVRPVPVRSRALGSAGRDEPGPGQYRSGRTTRRCGYESLAGQSEPRPFAVARKFWITASWSPAVAAEPYCTSSVFRWYAQCVPMAESR